MIKQEEYSDQVTLKIIATSEKFPTKVTNDFLKSVRSWFTENMDDKTALKVLAGLEQDFDRFPNLKQLADRARAFGWVKKSVNHIQREYCPPCNGQGYVLISVNGRNAAAACEHCRYGKSLIEKKKLYPLSAFPNADVIKLGTSKEHDEYLEARK